MKKEKIKAQFFSSPEKKNGILNHVTEIWIKEQFENWKMHYCQHYAMLAAWRCTIETAWKDAMDGSSGSSPLPIKIAPK